MWTRHDEELQYDMNKFLHCTASSMGAVVCLVHFVALVGALNVATRLFESRCATANNVDQD